jgi:hypothetical protein
VEAVGWRPANCAFPSSDSSLTWGAIPQWLYRSGTKRLILTTRAAYGASQDEEEEGQTGPPIASRALRGGGECKKSIGRGFRRGVPFAS